MASEVRQNLPSPEAGVPLREDWLFKNHDAVASVRHGLNQAQERKVQNLGSFAKYADDEID
ncbi:MAG: hypothetical protein ACREQI_10965 [Candidatus Binataceae bacterium]